jgi:nucleoside-diphosphate-sugar epimerase
MSRVLVTGAAGFVGAAAVRALLELGHDILAVVRPGTSSPRLAGLPVRALPIDLEDGPATARALDETRPEVILHAGWYANPRDYLTSARSLASLHATTHWLQAALHSGCRRFVGIGTCLEYARSDRPLAEDASCEPRTLYASCKLAAWLLARALVAGTSSVRPRLSLAWARLFNLYGPDENPGRLLPSLLDALTNRRPFSMTAGHQVRDYLHVDDAGRALALLCEQTGEGVINVASGQPLSVHDFAGAVASALGSTTLLRPGELPSRTDEDMFVVADVTRLRSLGFSPHYPTLADGIRQVLAAWRPC